MPHFYTGDELGKIKLVKCIQQSEGWKLEEQAAYTPAVLTKFASGETDAQGIRTQTVQRLTSVQLPEQSVLAAARANGTITAFSTNADRAELSVLKEWKETRFKADHNFVGLDATSKGLFWCTSNGALGFAPLEDSNAFCSTYQKASLPMRLKSWRMSPNNDTFAYGGDEVDLSLWDTERAFQSANAPSQVASDSAEAAGAKKRKRGNELLPGEIWRAKNLPNDSLSLRQPIHIKSLTYISSSNSASTSAHIVTGTETGDVRRYDTRAARRPVANWTGIGKAGGIGIVQASPHEHELFVSDNGTNLFALDLRNGHIIYSYKQLQGAITSIASQPSDSSTSASLMGSACRDRYFRLHSTFPPPINFGKQQEERGEVLGSLYMKTVPTAVVAVLGSYESNLHKDDEDEMQDDEDDVWAGMDGADESENESMDETRAKPRRNRRASRDRA